MAEFGGETSVIGITPTAAALAGLVSMTTISILSYFLICNRKPRSLPPGPPSVPILGSLPWLKRPSNEYFLEFIRLGKTYGGCFSLALGSTWVVVLNDFETIRDALVGKSIEFAGRIDDPREKHYRKYWPIRGIITSSYSVEWRNQRSYCMYLLRSQGWGKKGMEQLIGEEREALLEQLASKQGQPVWPRDILNVSTFNIICSFIFGRRFEYDDKQLLRVIHLLNWLATFFGESAERDFVPLLQMSPSYIKLILSFKGMNDEIAGFIKSQIDERRKRMIEDPSDTPRDFIESYLMGLKDRPNNDSQEEGDTNPNVDVKISEDWLHDIVTDLFFAGGETTSTTLTWAVLYMVKFPQVQAKVQEELDRVVGPPQPYGQTTLLDREKLPYCEATIMEVMRKSAIVPTAITHCTTKEANLRGCKIPANTQVRVNLYAALHDPATWPEPEVLRPERFLDDQGGLMKHEQWIPFSMGRRMCLGEQLAKQELFYFFTGLLHSFSIQSPEGAPEPDDQPVPGIILKAKPFQICLKPRFEVN